MAHFDFSVPEEYGGRKITLLAGMSDWPEEPVELLIPRGAFYLEVNPLEDGEEFLGNQDDSDRQQLNFYGQDLKYIGTQDLEHQIVTWRLMSRLENMLKKSN